MQSFLVALAFLLPAAEPADASRLSLSAPATVVEVDTGKLKGEPWRLAWSPDRTEIYLQTVERDRYGNTKAKHYLISAEGKNLKEAKAEPPWASRYWAWKSAPSAPQNGTVKIDVETRQQTANPTGGPVRGGDIAGMGATAASGGGPGPGAGGMGEGAGTVMRGAYANQSVRTTTLKLKGEVIGEWVNEPMAPGLTFGWSPADLSAIAYRTRDGELALMDLEGRKQGVEGTADVILPAWSDDGRALAYLQRKDRRKFLLQVLEVSKP